ncbi:ImuA family protein [Paracoccus pacificus]|uniref:ImuA family protein n=1 Tax=Paracoccus pacificus TaxID=1463598 RepID=A0ABW4R9S9_9RHOB
MSSPELSLVPMQDAPVAARCNEVFATGGAGWAGFVLAQMASRQVGNGPILWIQDRLSGRETGQPCFLSLSRHALLLELSHPRDVLIAAEEALTCADLGAVVAEVHGNPTALDFTCSRRLAIRAEASGVTLWLIRHAAEAQASAMRDRWRVSPLPSAPHPDDIIAPGDPNWRVELFRSRDKRPGTWAVRHDRAADHLYFSALVSDGALAEAEGAKRAAAHARARG